MIYIFPPRREDNREDEVKEIATRAGFPFVVAEKVFDLYDLFNTPIAIVRMGEFQLETLNRNASEILPELPSVVTDGPNGYTSTDWRHATDAFPIVSWDQVVKQMLKSGKTATTPDQLEERSSNSGYQQGHKAGDQKKSYSIMRDIEDNADAGADDDSTELAADTFDV